MTTDKNERSIKKKMIEDKRKENIQSILSKSKSVSFNNLIEIRNVKRIILAALCITINFLTAVRV